MPSDSRIPEVPTSWRSELSTVDRAVYAAVAGAHTPRMDAALRRLTSAADHSKLWIASSAVMAGTGGSRGRRAALGGLASIALASASVNLLIKPLAHRRRPDRDTAAVPEVRRVPMPMSTSFPSGHTASAFAFAGGVGGSNPTLGAPLTLAAAVVGYTRVHAGVHYPGDVVAGALIGMGCGELGPRLVDRAARRVARRAGG